ncbi:hypothetical protein D3C78_1328050 [compost metagenome]
MAKSAVLFSRLKIPHRAGNSDRTIQDRREILISFIIILNYFRCIPDYPNGPRFAVGQFLEYLSNYIVRTNLTKET